MIRRRRALGRSLGLAATAVALAACSVTTTTAPGSRGMMGGSGGGMMGARSASLSCSAPSLPGTTVQVALADMGMMGSAEGDAPLGARMMLRTDVVRMPAGQVSFVASNLGRRVHELVVLPLADGQRAGERVPGADGEVDETSSLGEASASCAGGTGEGIEAGTVGWVTLDLAPGRYELLCTMTNHYADGMWQEIVVA